ncbi:MAG: SAF domain-containing protein [Myxococcaceae bacterium]|nr:SAF domain-containing protein [Myxococcaceae bacterium]
MTIEPKANRPANAALWAIIGVVVGMVAGSAVSGFANKAMDDRACRDWKMTPVIVFVKDIKEGSQVTADDLALRNVPDVFVTRSVVTPAETNLVVGKRILVPVLAGDLAYFAQFDPLPQ